MQKLKKEILSHKLNYFLLGMTLVIGLFVRIYRTRSVLGFYFDQGRDALVIWDLIHKGKLFLIGPTTGIAGIFRGPFYYYLIAPFYWLGKGNPVWPAIFLAVTTMAAVVLIYYLTAKLIDRTTGLFAAIIASISFYMMLASRWLSNPTPMLLLSVLLVWMMYLATQGKKWAWPAMVFIAGSSLFHFGSAGELFYFVAILIFFIWQKGYKLPFKWIALGIVAGLITAAPLVLFDLKHDGILRNNILKFFVTDQSFKLSLWEVAKTRFAFYYDTFTVKIFLDQKTLEKFLLAGVGASFVVFLPKFWKNTLIRISVLLLASLCIGLLFFQGNQGNIYDYYLTGYYMIFILLFAVALGQLWKYIPGKVFVIIFFAVFLRANLIIDWYKISAGYDGPGTIVMGNQLQAIDWIYQEAAGRPFNVDVYVPPVIPYAYDYLFKWYGGDIKGAEPKTELVPLLYTLVEDDPPHPDRRDPWLVRQDGIGRIVKEATFGGIVAQERVRIK